MDPNATLRDLLDAVQLRDWDQVEELAQSLLTWIENRGFPPTTLGPKELGSQWHKTLTTFVCYLALTKAREARKRRERRDRR